VDLSDFGCDVEDVHQLTGVLNTTFKKTETLHYLVYVYSLKTNDPAKKPEVMKGPVDLPQLATLSDLIVRLFQNMRI
jgi:hypothetical protein